MKARSRTRLTTCSEISFFVRRLQTRASLPIARRGVAFRPHFALYDAYSRLGSFMVSTSISSLDITAPSWCVNSQVASLLSSPKRVTVKVTDPFSVPAAVAALSQGQFSLASHINGIQRDKARNRIPSDK